MSTTPIPASRGGQKRILNLLQLELQEVVNCLILVLGPELGPSARTANALRSCTISPTKDNLSSQTSTALGHPEGHF